MSLWALLLTHELGGLKDKRAHTPPKEAIQELKIVNSTYHPSLRNFLF